MKKEIWAIGGGKGGTGKSVLSALFATHAAGKKRKVILVDGDLGGANLHTFFNVSPDQSSLNEFFEKKTDLKDTLIDTGVSGLKLISGDMRSFNPLSVKYIQRLKFYRHLKQLNADIIIIDLGAGTGLNTLDSFLLADKMILVSTAEITSIENLYLFVKKIIVRKIKDMLSYEGFRDIDQTIVKTVLSSRETIKFSDFIELLKGMGKDQEKIVNDGLGEVRINLVLNQIREKVLSKYGISLKNILKRHYNIDALFSGYVNYNDKVRELANGDADINSVFKIDEIGSSIDFISGNIKKGSDVNFNEL
ncbi:MAG: AAA family ATPase [Candidatus Aminicenantes bacterium]|nr:AAA family ATPase [Candidatus Aminicenantes bacterium]